MGSLEVQVTIKYLVSVREKTGRREEEVSFPSGSTLHDIADWLGRTYGIKLPSPQLMAILNGRGWGQYPDKMLTEVKEGDVICIFSLIFGG